MKKFYLFLIALIALSAQSWAIDFSYTYQGQTLYYYIVDGNAQVIYQNSSSPRYTNLTGSLTIPSSVTYNGTTYSVTSILYDAFSGCTGLTSVTIPNSVTSIGERAFYGCSGLTSLTIGNSVTSIGDYAFLGCSGLESIIVESGNTVYDSRNNCNAIIETSTNRLILGGKNTVIPNSVTSIGYGAFYGCTGLTGTLTIPNSVTSIGENAFQGCSGLTSLTLGNSVTSIGYRAFRNCSSLTGTLTIPNSVTSIGDYAFLGCSGLTSLTIGNSVTSISNFAFQGCSGLTSVTIPNSVTSIGEYAFQGCSGLTSVTIPNSVTSIGENAFQGCSGLTSVTIPNSVTSIGYSAFQGCSGLESIIVGSGNTVYDSRNNCNAIIESSSNKLILGCKNTVIPNSVTSIGSSAFKDCSGLTGTLTIPNSVTSIGIDAFYNCSGITEIHSLNPVPPTLGTNAFYSIPTNIPVYIPCGRVPYYTAADGWSSFTNFIESSAASFSAVSNDNTMGSVQILTMPTCTNPQAVVYAVANSGYQFDHWSDNSTSNPYSLTVNEDMELTAYFSPIGSQPTTYYTITVTTNDAEMGTVTGGGSFAEGTTTTIAATANSGYHFVQWQDGNTEASRSITVTADAEYTAYFAANGANEYTITVIAQNPSMGSTTGSGTFAYGTVTTITAEPYEGYYFVQWNDGNTQRIRTITVTGNATYTAYFDRSNGIDDITAEEVKVHVRGSEIVVEGAENADALVYDVMGRIVHKGRIEGPIHVNSTGVYMVKIGGQKPQKVVVR